MATDYPRDDINDVDVHIARTTFQNRNFLAPNDERSKILLYDVVLKLLENDQIVTGLMTTTTDLEITATDTNGERSAYTQQCHGMLARHLNTSLGRDDGFWKRGGPDQCVLCDDPEEALEQLARMFARPVEQCLVEDLSHWNGAMILPEQWGKKRRLFPHIQSTRATHQRPIEFTPMPPAVLQRHYSLEECRRLANEAIAARVDMLNQTRFERSGRSTVLGRRRCKAIDPLSRRDQPRRAPLPHFVGTKTQVDEAMRELRQKRRFYRECLELFRGEDKDVVFAAGTVRMRRLGAYCDPLPKTTMSIPHGSSSSHHRLAPHSRPDR